MKNNFKKLMKISFFIILNIINIYFFISNILFGIYSFGFGLLDTMSIITENIYFLCIILNIILQIYLIIIFIRNCIKYKSKTNINIIFYTMLLYIINITNNLLYTFNNQYLLIFTIFYIIYFIVKERKVSS